MNTQRWASLAAIAALGLAMTPALANKPVFFTLSGNVTAAPSGGEITVDGHAYHIQSGSSAAAQVSGVLPGDAVQLQLSGPPDSNSTEVVAIHATHSR